MYEIWLMLNIVYEIVLPLWPVLLVLLLAWLGLMVAARRRLAAGLCWPVFGLGLLAAVLALLLLPAATQSALGNLDYWVDWAMAGGIALGAGVAVALFAWPLLALRSRAAEGA